MCFEEYEKQSIKIEYSLFWIVFSFLLLVLSIFPQIAIALADLCGISVAGKLYIFIYDLYSSAA